MRFAPVLLFVCLGSGCVEPSPRVPVDPLLTAVRANDVTAVLAQLDAGAAANARAADGSLPMVEAARLGRDTIVAELLAAGADPLIADIEGDDAWNAVMQSGQLAVADRLLLHAAREAGAGPTVLRWFAGVRGEEASPPRWQEVLNGELLPLGLMYAALHDRADLITTMRRGREMPNRTGYHALVVAARWGRRDAVAALLAIDLHPDFPTARRTTALMEAARDGRIAVARELLAAGADPNHPDQHGETPLHWAARLGQPAYAEALVRAGADPRRRDVSGKTPADVTLGDGRIP
jgi:ankyrin repeat protein